MAENGVSERALLSCFGLAIVALLQGKSSPLALWKLCFERVKGLLSQKKNAKRATSMVNKGNLNAEEERFQRWMVLSRKACFSSRNFTKIGFAEKRFAGDKTTRLWPIIDLEWTTTTKRKTDLAEREPLQTAIRLKKEWKFCNHCIFY